jgi:succinate dehydrogenase/fumarate reductase-like Fe-S protein
MTSLDPQLLAMIAGTTGVGFLMTIAGVQKSALEWRRRQRSCPSCGRRIEGRVCGSCSR